MAPRWRHQLGLDLEESSLPPDGNRSRQRGHPIQPPRPQPPGPGWHRCQLPVGLAGQPAVGNNGDADDCAEILGAWRLDTEVGGRLALDRAVGAGGVEEKLAAVSGGPGPD